LPKVATAASTSADQAASYGCVILGIRLILPQHIRKSKNGTLGDTLIIFDNNSRSFC
jgi:hypothetical protein